MEFRSSDLKYEIFAYEFVDSNSALKYYINVTGQTSYEKELPLDESYENKRLSSSKGMSSYRLIAVYQNKAYVIVAPKQYEDIINKMLASTFSFQISWVTLVDDFSAALSGAAVFHPNTCKFDQDVLYLW